MTYIASGMSAAVSLLSASAGPGGAAAKVATAETGSGRLERDPEALRAAVREKDRAWLEYAKKVGRTRYIADPGERVATIHRLMSIKARIADMLKALESLRSVPALNTGTVVGVHTGNGNDVLAIWTQGAVDSVYTNGGDDSVAIQASVADSIYTKAGADAVAIEADVVDGVSTGDGPDADAVAIRARSVDSIYTGAGRDAVAVQADLVSSIYTGADGDSLSVTAGAVRGIHTQDGDDSVVIDAVLGGSQGYSWYRLEPTPTDASAVAQRLYEAQTGYADVHLGDGNDALSVRVDEVISVEGGRGDDVISIGGGTVALHFGAGDGNDRIGVARGATVAVQLDNDLDWSASWDGDALVLTLGSGSMRIEGASGAAAIGISAGERQEHEILYMAPVLDRSL